MVAAGQTQLINFFKYREQASPMRAAMSESPVQCGIGKGVNFKHSREDFVNSRRLHFHARIQDSRHFPMTCPKKNFRQSSMLEFFPLTFHFTPNGLSTEMSVKQPRISTSDRSIVLLLEPNYELPDTSYQLLQDWAEPVRLRPQHLSQHRFAQ